MAAVSSRRSRVRNVTGYATKAQANAGYIILPAAVSGAYAVVGGWFRANGNTTETTTVNINDTTSTNVVCVATAAAALGTTVVAPFDAAANVTRTTYGTALNPGKALQIITVGTDETTATGWDYSVDYVRIGGGGGI